MLLSKTVFKLNAMKMEGCVYQCVLSSCAENSIYEINEMLEASGIPPLGNEIMEGECLWEKNYLTTSRVKSATYLVM